MGVVGHGLDSIYPAEHSNLAEKMIDYGGLLSDFTSETKLAPENFPKRNRIIAGLSDAVIVANRKDPVELLLLPILPSHTTGRCLHSRAAARICIPGDVISLSGKIKQG